MQKMTKKDFFRPFSYCRSFTGKVSFSHSKSEIVDSLIIKYKGPLWDPKEVSAREIESVVYYRFVLYCDI